MYLIKKQFSKIAIRNIRSLGFFHRKFIKNLSCFVSPKITSVNILFERKKIFLFNFKQIITIKYFIICTGYLFFNILAFPNINLTLAKILGSVNINRKLFINCAKVFFKVEILVLGREVII